MIDAHFHCWKLGENDCTWPTAAQPAIHRDVLPDHWRALAEPLGIEGGVIVQSQESAADTQWLLELAAAHDFILGVVGWANLKTGPLPESPWLKGLRPMVQGRPSAWLDDPALDRQIAAMTERGLVFDGLVRPKHLPALRRRAIKHPDLAIVIDHAGKPQISHGWIGEWKAQIVQIAAQPNVSCKLSGLLTEALPGQDAIVADVVGWLYEIFGPERLIWGSDWPVVEMAGTYGGWLKLAQAAIPVDAHAAVFGCNARRVYGL